MTVGRGLDFADFGSVQSLAENYDVECKLAGGRDGLGQFPASALDSYSAFANTEGGWLVLGVEETRGQLNVVGVADPARVQRQRWDTVNNREAVSANVLRNSDVQVIQQGDAQLVVIRVPAASRQERPVYVGTNPFGGTFLRNFEGDYQADDDTVRRMLAEVATVARDSEVLSDFGLDDLDLDSLAQFRNLFQSASPGHPFLAASDEELLRSLGGMRRDRSTGTYHLTTAGLLMFGALPSIRERFPRYNVDFQEHSSANDRWVDRVTADGTWAGNLFQFYRRVLPKLLSGLRVPFELDAGLRRSDTTRAHTAIREALVNALVHADYDAATPIRIVRRETSYEFRNPGRLRLPKEQVLAGGMSDCRNPAIQTMFQMIGAGERAGSGFPTILGAWREQHWRAPRLEQDTQIECTTLTLPITSLLPAEAVDALREHLGRRLDELGHNERAVLVTAWVEHHVTHERMMQVLEIHSRDLTLLLERLVRDALLHRLGRGRGCYYELGAEFGEASLPNMQAAPALANNGGDAPPLAADERDQRHSASSLPTNESSLPTNESSLPTNASSLPTNESSLPTNESSLPTNELSAAADGWAAPLSDELQAIAAGIRATKRATRSELDAVLAELCRVQPLTLRQLSELVGREPKGLRDKYLTRLAREGRIRMRYPERISHPAQAYIADAEDEDD